LLHIPLNLETVTIRQLHFVCLERWRDLWSLDSRWWQNCNPHSI